MKAHDERRAALHLDGAAPCADLRSKRFFFLKAPPRTAADLIDGSCALWCDRTQQAIGPDSQVVAPDDCRAGRACFRSWQSLA